MFRISCCHNSSGILSFSSSRSFSCCWAIERFAIRFLFLATMRCWLYRVIILILISLLIGCFKFIPQIQEKFSKKNKQPAAAPAAAPVVAAPVEEEEETSDEELIAVIAAAIAASEGSTSTDGFVVRSIRRRSGSWKNA